MGREEPFLPHYSLLPSAVGPTRRGVELGLDDQHIFFTFTLHPWSWVIVDMVLESEADDDGACSFPACHTVAAQGQQVHACRLHRSWIFVVEFTVPSEQVHLSYLLPALSFCLAPSRVLADVSELERLARRGGDRKIRNPCTCCCSYCTVLHRLLVATRRHYH